MSELSVSIEHLAPFKIDHWPIAQTFLTRLADKPEALELHHYFEQVLIEIFVSFRRNDRLDRLSDALLRLSRLAQNLHEVCGKKPYDFWGLVSVVLEIIRESPSFLTVRELRFLLGRLNLLLYHQRFERAPITSFVLEEILGIMREFVLKKMEAAEPETPFLNEAARYLSDYGIFSKIAYEILQETLLEEEPALEMESFLEISDYLIASLDKAVDGMGDEENAPAMLSVMSLTARRLAYEACRIKLVPFMYFAVALSGAAESLTHYSKVLNQEGRAGFKKIIEVLHKQLHQYAGGGYIKLQEDALQQLILIRRQLLVEAS